MRLILDTCAILHLAADPDRLSKQTQQLVVAESSEISVLAMSAGELACLCERGRVRLPEHWRTWFRKAAAENGWKVLPVTLEAVEEAWSLPEPIHRDPVDRLLIAASRLDGMTMVTTDRLMLEYPHVRSVS